MNELDKKLEAIANGAHNNTTLHINDELFYSTSRLPGPPTRSSALQSLREVRPLILNTPVPSSISTQDTWNRYKQHLRAEEQLNKTLRENSLVSTTTYERFATYKLMQKDAEDMLYQVQGHAQQQIYTEILLATQAAIHDIQTAMDKANATYPKLSKLLKKITSQER